MDARTAYARRDSIAFLDVRERYEWDAGHIEGSLHIPITQLPGRTGEVPSERTVVVVCQIGQRSELAARFLREHGYDAHNLEGGVTVWTAEGLPLAGAGGPGEIVDGYARDFNGLLADPARDDLT